ncbi:unnamed protein product, partial [Choristocarpus tenellus]
QTRKLEHKHNPIPAGTRRASMEDTAAQIESAAPELLPLWLRHWRQVPEELGQDLNVKG